MSYPVGLTGGIGSGKSTVAALFSECGATVIDSDSISHELTAARGEAIPAIRAAFGQACLDADGALDRAHMRKIVFSDPAARRRLESILHPLIRSRMRARADEAGTAPYQILVIPLLFETPDYQTLVRRTLVVDCAESTQLARAMQRSGLDQPTVSAIMATQASRAERLKRADDVIVNEGGLDALRREVHALHQRYLALAAKKG